MAQRGNKGTLWHHPLGTEHAEIGEETASQPPRLAEMLESVKLAQVGPKDDRRKLDSHSHTQGQEGKAGLTLTYPRTRGESWTHTRTPKDERGKLESHSRTQGREGKLDSHLYTQG